MKNDFDVTPLRLAENRNNLEIVNYLQQMIPSTNSNVNDLYFI